MAAPEPGAGAWWANICAPVRTSADGRVTLRLLSPRRTILSIKWCNATLAPQGALHSEPHAAGTCEHLACLDGALRVALSGETFDFHRR